MQNTWNISGNKETPSDPAVPGDRRKQPAKADPASLEAFEFLVVLMIISYVLNLIKERGTLLLPRNWQN